MLSKLYNRSLEHIIFPVGDRIEGGSFFHWLRQYRGEQWLSARELERIQFDRLAQILAYARTNVPFYKNIDHLSDSFEFVKQFPVMRKTDINEHINQLVTQPKEKLIAESGSGSTGIQGTVYMDKSAQASQRAMQMLWFEWSGYRMGDSILQTGITPKRGFVKKAKDYFLNTDYTPAFNLDTDAVRKILRKVEKQPRQYLFGYASSLYVLAQTAVELGISNINFKHAVSWGDKLFPHYRKVIRQAFGCETLDTYGCTEGTMIGAECPQGKFHLSINQCFLEIVDDDGLPVPPGNIGKVLATRLDNYAMPLIRYYVGDLAELEPGEPTTCACGRSLPLLRRVVGRDTDIVRTRSGKQMIVHFFTGIFEHIPQIQQFKVVQENLDEINIFYIPKTDFRREVLSEIEARIYVHLQEKLPINWIETSRIEATKSGKPQIIQSFLKQSLSH